MLRTCVSMEVEGVAGSVRLLLVLERAASSAVLVVVSGGWA